MANIRNIDAETGANYIGDDSSPTLEFENTSTGSAISAKNTGATTGVAVEAQVAATAAPTIAVLRSTNSVASGAHFEFRGFLASIASATSITRGVRVKVGDDYYWIPLYKSATYI